VPNESIYTQTIKALRNREHPYRQILDRASAGRTKIIEKLDRLDKRDVDHHLCVNAVDAAIGQPENQRIAETVPGSRQRPRLFSIL
jgi:type III restriction enzyme